MGSASKRGGGGRHAARGGGLPVATVLSSDGQQSAPAHGTGWSRKAQVGGLAAGVLVVGGLLGAGVPARLGEPPQTPKNASSPVAPQAAGTSRGMMRTIAPVDRSVPSSHAAGQADRSSTPRGRHASRATRGSAHDRSGSPSHSRPASAAGGTSAGHAASSTAPPARHSPAARAPTSRPNAGSAGSPAPTGAPHPHTHAHHPLPQARSAAPDSKSAGGAKPRGQTLPKSSAGRQPTRRETGHVQHRSHPAPTTTPSPTRDTATSPPVTVESPRRGSCAVNLLGLGLICQ
jgi:hypothetical protein